MKVFDFCLSDFDKNMAYLTDTLGGRIRISKMPMCRNDGLKLRKKFTEMSV